MRVEIWEQRRQKDLRKRYLSNGRVKSFRNIMANVHSALNILVLV